MSLIKTKKVTITMTEEQHQKAKELSKKLWGKENVSGLYSYMLIKLEKELND